MPRKRPSTWSGLAILAFVLSLTPAASAQVNCSGVAAWSSNSVNYAVGALVTYNGSEYQCIQANTSQSGWDPVDAPSLWQDNGTCSGGGGSAEAPYGGTPWSLPGTVQAENFDTGGDNVAYYTTDNINHGGQYRTSEGVSIETTSDTGGGYDVGWTAAGQWMNYTVNVTASGSYIFNLRCADPGTGAQVYFEVDGANVTGAMNIPNTGGWQTWATISSGAVNLTAGQHVITLYEQTAGTAGVGNYNWFSVTSAGSAEAPYGGTAWSLPGTVQAENFDTGGDNVAYYTTDNINHGGQYRTSEGVSIETTSDTGGGYDVGWTAAGQWMNYTVNVTASGSYIFNLRCADPGTGAQVYFEVDGANVTGSMNIPNTGGWQTWATISSGAVNLTAGQHVITLYEQTAGTAGVGNYNWFSVTSAGSAEAPYGGAPWPLPGTVQAENFDTGGDNVAYYTTDNINHGGQYRTSEGVSIETTSDTGGGYDVGWTAAGQWMNYTVNVTASGSYYFNLRCANTGSGAAVHFSVDGSNVTGSMAIPNTGGWQTWTTISSGAVNLSAGQHIVQLYEETNGSNGSVGNFNWWSISTSSSGGGGGGGGTPPSGFVFSQYKDISVNANWNTGEQQSAVTGTVQPVTSAMPSNNSTLTWAFATGTCGSENWAGIPVSQEVTNVQDFVNAGKYYIVSTGGAGGSFDCPTTAGFISFIQTYYSSHMLGVDFDIESGQSQSVVDNLINDVKAAESQYPNLRFSFTVATLGGTSNPDLGQEGAMVVNEIKNLGLGGNYTVNLMVMDYGSTNSSNCVVVNGACEMGQSAVQAAEALNSQYGIPYANIELTPMIGQNDTSGEIFTLSDADTVSSFVKQNGLAGIHFWSFDRDDACGGASSSTCDSYTSGGVLGFTSRFLSDLGY